MFGGMGGGRGPAAPAGPKWEELYFHQKVKHLVDSAGSVIFDYSSWWMPAVAVSSAVTVVLFSGPIGIPQLLQAGTMIASPIPPPSTFGTEMPGQQGGAPQPDMDDEDEE